MKLACLIAALALAAAGCSTKRSEEGKAPVTAPAAEAPAAPAPVTAPTAAPAAVAAPTTGAAVDDSIPAGYPPECVAYAALIGKLASCDKVAGARDGLRAAYASIRAGWSAVPASRRDEVAAQCKTQADSLRNAAAAACGW